MSPPPPLDYRPPRSPEPHRAGSVGLFLAGIGAGLGMSFVVYWIAIRISGKDISSFVTLAAIGLIIAKLALGIHVEHKSRRRGFFPGIITSIPLVPLLGIGLVVAACSGWL